MINMGNDLVERAPRQLLKDGVLQMAARLERIDFSAVNESELDAYWDRDVHQSFGWVNFIAANKSAEPVLAQLRENGKTLGYFTGLIEKRFGFRILGSPFRGWSSLYMGFNLKPGEPRSKAIQALERFAFYDLKCHHLEVMDRFMEENDYESDKWVTWPWQSFEVDLTRPEDRIFASFEKDCRRSIRKSAKNGVWIEQAEDMEFAQDYYEQLKEAYGLRGLTPPYDLDRIRDLIRHLHPTGKLLLLRARDQEGACVATGLFPAWNRNMYSWGAAGWKWAQSLRPNEVLLWEAMRYWKSRGVRVYDMTGRFDYKRKYNPVEIQIPWLRKSKYPILETFRNIAKSAYPFYQETTGKLARMKKRISGKW
jgi:hypothetical protein